MVKISEISRIHSYVFLGQLPQDLRSHLIGGINQDLCVFCREYSSHDNTLITLYGEDVTNAYELERNYSYEVSCCNRCYELFNNASKANTKEAREARYYLGVHGAITNEEFLKKEGYYDHERNSDKCCICKSECGPNLRIMPPVSVESEKIYSLLSICPFCDAEVARILQGKDLFDSYQKDVCAKCSGEYPITASELSYRKNMGTLGGHYCPECCCESELTGLIRFNPTSCSAYECSNTTTLDITLADFLEVQDGMYYCELHSENNSHTLIIESYKIVARKVDGLFYYAIVLIGGTDPRSDELLYDSEEYNEYFNTEYNALFYGSTQVYSIINMLALQKEQKELKKVLKDIMGNMGKE